MQDADVVVIGAGFGGLGAALSLAEGGARVVLLEALRYPGGCASTFTRAGHRYESGATLSSGFDPAQPFARWIARHDLPVQVERLDPVIHLRAPDLSLDVPASRDALIADLVARSPGREERIRGFFATQRAVADALWALFDDPALLPPFDLRALRAHIARAPRYLPALRWIARPLAAVLSAHGLDDFAPLRIYLDALCQITVQAGVDEAEAPFAMAAMDYPFRGAAHVRGGIGALADGLVLAITRSGGVVRFSDAVHALREEGGAWRVSSRRGELRARAVVANVLPQDLASLWGRSTPQLDVMGARVEEGWGAAMLYLTLREDAALAPGAQHHELIADPRRPLIEGNHVFVSISASDEDRGPRGARTATVSTHVPMRRLRAMTPEAQGAYIAGVQGAMRETIRAVAPAVDGAITGAITGSPRTFARFTRRAHGYVGGIPRRAGLGNYRELVPPAITPGLHLVGDTVFPGQSALATAIGGMKVAARLLGDDR